LQLLIGEDAFDQDPGGGVMRPGGGLRRSIEVGRSPSLASHVVVEHLANRRPDVWLGHVNSGTPPRSMRRVSRDAMVTVRRRSGLPSASPSR
jgi:hypothetical protein